MRPTAHILTVGAELLAGDILDTNAREISRALQDVGLSVTYRATLPDDVPTLSDAIRRSLDSASVVVVTGGLGPTPDDVTREGIAAAFGVTCEFRPDLLPALEARYTSYTHRAMPEQNLLQITLPVGATAIVNPVGTAPGFRMDTPTCALFVVPGIPREMRGMLHDTILPWLRERHDLSPVATRTVRTMGIGESDLIKAHGEFLSALPGVEVAYYPQQPGEDIKLIALDQQVESAQQALDAAEVALRARLGTLIYATGKQSLAAAVGELLLARGATVATAESCTGGALAHALIAPAGASRYVDRGVVAYANQAKVDLLGVPESLLIEHGAVSEPVARAMAEGLRARSGVDYTISTTGIAGPGGGSVEKPVGLVYSAIAAPSGTLAWRSTYPGTREMVIQRAVATDLNRLRHVLLDSSGDR